MEYRRTVIMALGAVVLTVLGPAIVAGLGTPETVVLDALVDEYQPVLFSHGTHAARFAGDCAFCHHQHEISGRILCGNCHNIASDSFRKAVVNSFTPCRNCHAEYNPEMPEMPSLKVAYHRKCFKCHRGMGNLGKSPAGCTEMCHAGRSE